jgi:hypothetical protein
MEAGSNNGYQQSEQTLATESQMQETELQLGLPLHGGIAGKLGVFQLSDHGDWVIEASHRAAYTA